MVGCFWNEYSYLT